MPVTRSTFEVTAWDEHEGDPHDGNAGLKRATVKKRFDGDIDGESIAELVMVGGGDTRSYVAIERFEGTVSGRAGTFLFQHGGTQEGEKIENFGTVIPGLATGELKDLRGTTAFQHDAEGAIFTLKFDSLGGAGL